CSSALSVFPAHDSIINCARLQRRVVDKKFRSGLYALSRQGGSAFMENNVELRGLCRRFSGKVALDGLTFRMEGGVFCLLGGKGAGKSTLLRILATLLPGDGGEALV